MLGENLFDAEPRGYVFGIRGYSFEMFKEQITDRARNNLQMAVDKLIAALEDENIEEIMGEKS